MTSPTEPQGLQGQRYERLGVLGSGGQGTVYRAFDRWTGRPVAIKVLNSRAAREPHMVERLSREQQALNALRGTAAVEVLDIYRGSDGELCLVMELLTGTTLDEYLQKIEERQERIELDRVAEIFDPIVETLEVAHKSGILHRDLKPANVFLLDDGGVRLLDFGMARLRRSAPLTADGTVMGSPSFMAPEAWKGQSSQVDHRADVYSLGVILFRVIAGDLPFTGLSLYEKFLGTTTGARPSLVAKRPDLPADTDEWVALALAIDREQRFRNVRALWNAFLATFHLDPPKRGGRHPSFWAKAAGRMKGLAGMPDSARSADPPAPGEVTPVGAEPSFVTAALARSVMPPGPETAPTVEITPLSGNEPTIEVAEGPPTLRREAELEKTAELLPAPETLRRDPTREKTVELDADLLVPESATPKTALPEKTDPIGVPVPPPPPVRHRP